MITHYPHLIDAKSYPDYHRRPVKVPIWETFAHKPQFATLRCFAHRDGKFLDWRRDIRIYTEKFKLGRMLWLMNNTVHSEELPDIVAEIKKRDLFLFDIWGHVPGTRSGQPGCKGPPSAETVEYLKSQLGDHFLGFSNGEQDGRYISTFSKMQCPQRHDRFALYLNFQKHFERVCDELGNCMSALVSLCFGHYFLKEGNHLLLGAETAQALPNSQVYYAFIRGAGKQYGVLSTGNASVYNRWGIKVYAGNETGPATDKRRAWGPTKGTSLSLMRRLMYSHIFYNCAVLGFEQNWIEGDDDDKRRAGIPSLFDKDPDAAPLSPIGQIQASAVRFVEEHHPLGVMHAPVALLLDHFAGWTFPRHLYTSCVYQVWGAMPYGPGDYLTHGILELLYPGYEDSGYYLDERGFLTATPFGDMADCLLSDVPGVVLQRYGLVIAAGKLTATNELRDKLEAFVESGGHLVVTGDNARELWPRWQICQPETISGGTIIAWHDGHATREPHDFSLCRVQEPHDWRILATCGQRPVVMEMTRGNGRVTLILGPYAINDATLINGPLKAGMEEPLPQPFILTEHMRECLSKALAAEQLFEVGDRLGFISCRKECGCYLLAIFNNTWQTLPFRIVSRCGDVLAVEEVAIDQSAKSQLGYTPDGMELDNANPDRNDTMIAGGDVRIFRVQTKERNVRLLEQVAFPERPRQCILSMARIHDLKTAVLSYPTFFQYFDGVKVDWGYLRCRDSRALAEESIWLKRQKLNVMVDFSSGINQFSGLSLVDNRDAMEELLVKMRDFGSGQAIIRLHRLIERSDIPNAEMIFIDALNSVCERASKYGMSVYLQNHPSGHGLAGSASEALGFIQKVNRKNLFFAFQTGHGRYFKENVDAIAGLKSDKLGMVLLSGTEFDAFGQIYDSHACLANSGCDIRALGRLQVPFVLDADYYGDWDKIYGDLKVLFAQLGLHQFAGWK